MTTKITITPYGGLGEIGMNCMLIETDSTAILIDCGLMFSDLEHFGVEFVIPNFANLLKKKDKIKAIFATHGHEDHIGALSFAIRAGIRAPIYSSQFTSLMIRERLNDSGLLDAVELRSMHSGGQVEIGDLKITTVNVNHSIIDAFALFIDTPLGKIIHTGDFKLNPTAFFGDVMELNLFKKAGDDGVLLLLSDSTNVERDHHVHDEAEVAQNLEEVIRSATGMVVVSMFSSNVGRMANIFKLAEKLGKKIALTGRSMEQNVRLAHERGAINLDASHIIPVDEIRNYDRTKMILLSTGCQGEPRSALNRMAHGEHQYVTLTEGDLVVLSSSQIPGNEVSISKLINQLFKQGPEVIYDAVEDVHTSGHATRPELKIMLEMIKPKFFVPIHGEYRHLVHHARLAEEVGLKESNICIVKNGEVFEVTKDAIQIVDEITELRILVEDRDGQELSKEVLKDRRKIAETGVVFCLLSREKDSGRILTKPEIHAKGLVSPSFELWLNEEAIKIVEAQIQQYKKDLKDGVRNDLAEEVRIDLRRFYDRNIGRKPVVISIILDV
jgi:ribonuclease J